MSALNYDRDRLKWCPYGGGSKNKIKCDLNRICEVEDMATEWYEAQYYF